MSLSWVEKANNDFFFTRNTHRKLIRNLHASIELQKFPKGVTLQCFTQNKRVSNWLSWKQSELIV